MLSVAPFFACSFFALVFGNFALQFLEVHVHSENTRHTADLLWPPYSGDAVLRVEPGRLHWTNRFGDGPGDNERTECAQGRRIDHFGLV